MEGIIRSRQGRRWHGRSSGYWNEQEGMGGRSSVGHLDQIGASRDSSQGGLPLPIWVQSQQTGDSP